MISKSFVPRGFVNAFGYRAATAYNPFERLARN
jgi:hypothetical protein